MTDQQPVDLRAPALGLQWAAVLVAVSRAVWAVAALGGGSKRLNGAMAAFMALFTVIEYVVGIVWIRRCRANAELLSPGGQPYGRGWTTAGWVLPGLNLWMRWRIMLGFWRGSGVPGPPGPVHAWWALLLTGSVAGLVSYVPGLHRIASPVTAAIGLVHAVLVVVVIRRITTRQVEALAIRPATEPAAAGAAAA